jgi:hypothetical protein
MPFAEPIQPAMAKIQAARHAAGRTPVAPENHPGQATNAVE